MSTTTPFSQHLAHLNKGLTDAELTEALADIVPTSFRLENKAAISTALSGLPMLDGDI